MHFSAVAAFLVLACLSLSATAHKSHRSLRALHHLEDRSVLATSSRKTCVITDISVDLIKGFEHIGADSTCSGPVEDETRTCYNMTATDIKNLMKNAVPKELGSDHFTCIDGRHVNESPSTPGGDMGVFLSAAEVFIQGSDDRNDYSEKRLEHLLRGFIEKFRTPEAKFYMHTDQGSVKRVKKGLADAGIDANVWGEYAEDGWVPSDKEAKKTLVHLLSDAAIGVGCGHIKLMAENPKMYGLANVDLVTNTLKAFWKLKFGSLKDSIHVEILKHDHGERALISMLDIEGCPGFSPLLSKVEEDDDVPVTQIFLVHTDAIKRFRKSVSKWFIGRDGAADISADKFNTQLDKLADGIQLVASGKILAKYRPAFAVQFTGRIV